MATPVDKLLLRSEVKNKTRYVFRVTNTERAPFKPLVIMTAATCSRFHRRLAELITVKCKERCSHVLRYGWTRISCAMLIIIQIIKKRKEKKKLWYEMFLNLALGSI